MAKNEEYKNMIERMINVILAFTTKQLREGRMDGILVSMKEIETFIKIYEELISKERHVEIVHL